MRYFPGTGPVLNVVGTFFTADSFYFPLILNDFSYYF